MNGWLCSISGSEWIIQKEIHAEDSDINDKALYRVSLLEEVKWIWNDICIADWNRTFEKKTKKTKWWINLMATIYANSSKPKVRLWQEREEKESARFKRNKREKEA